jgi:hypothetical protein
MTGRPWSKRGSPGSAPAAMSRRSWRSGRNAFRSISWATASTLPMPRSFSPRVEARFVTGTEIVVDWHDRRCD